MIKVERKQTALSIFSGAAVPFPAAITQVSAGANAYAGEYEKLAGKVISALVIVEYGFLAVAGILIFLALCQYLPANGNMMKTESAKKLFVLTLVSAGVALLAAVIKTALPLLPDAIKI